VQGSPNEQYVYIFVRQDISLPQQIVQSNHATLSFSSHHGVEGIPNIVLIGVPNVAALKEACALLSANQIPHWSWTEPDFNLGFTAICTAAISGSERLCLAHYRTWKPVFPSSANCKLAVSNTAHAGAGPAEGTNAAVA